MTETATARDRIVVAARRCFAAKGFAGTTIADIEEAAGYEPRTGGLYRHHRSKEAIFEAVIDHELAVNQAEVVEAEPPPPGLPPRQALRLLVDRALGQLDAQQDLARLINRDLDRFPALLARVRDELVDRSYAAMAAALPEDMDREAVAVVLAGSVVDFKLKSFLYGTPPLGLSDDRFAAAWVDLAAAFLAPRPTAGATGARR